MKLIMSSSNYDSIDMAFYDYAWLHLNYIIKANYMWTHAFTLILTTSYDHESMRFSRKFHDSYELSFMMLRKTNVNDCEFSHLNMNS